MMAPFSSRSGRTKRIRMLTALAALLPLSVGVHTVWAGTRWVPSVTHLCRPVSDAFTVDGILDEPGWQGLDTLTLVLNDALADGEPGVRTRVLTAWSPTRLYVAFLADSKNIRNTLTAHDAALYEQDVVEMFLDPDGDGKDYFELEWSCLNASLDYRFASRLQGLDEGWAPPGMQNAVEVRGTPNHPGDVDTGMTVEIALPWAAFRTWWKGSLPPRAGDSLPVNFYRIDYSSNQDGELIAWSPIGAADFHRPDKFGALVFSSQPVTSVFTRPRPATGADRGGGIRRTPFRAFPEGWLGAWGDGLRAADGRLARPGAAPAGSGLSGTPRSGSAPLSRR